MLSGQRSRTSTQNFASNRRAIRSAAETKNRCGVEAITRSGLPNCPEIPAHSAEIQARKKDCSIIGQGCRHCSAEFQETRNRHYRFARGSGSLRCLVKVMKSCTHYQRPVTHPGPGISQPKWPPMTAQARQVPLQMDATARCSCICLVRRFHNNRPGELRMHAFMDTRPENVHPRAPRNTASSAFRDPAAQIAF